MLRKDDLAFFIDVDMTVSVSLVRNCRRHTKQGKQVWMPIVYSQFDPKYMHVNRERKISDDEVSEEAGYWRVWGFGMTCIYKSDYDRSGGFDLSLIGWGVEDVLLCSAVVGTGIDVFRFKERNLLHKFHTKKCASSLMSELAKICHTTKYNHYACQRNLAELYYLRKSSTF